MNVRDYLRVPSAVQDVGTVVPVGVVCPVGRGLTYIPWWELKGKLCYQFGLGPSIKLPERASSFGSTGTLMCGNQVKRESKNLFGKCRAREYMSLVIPLIFFDHWSNSSRFLIPSTCSVDCFHTFGYSMHVDWLSFSLLPSNFQVGDGCIERIFTFSLV